MWPFWRNPIQSAIRALQDQLAGGARAEIPHELELVGSLIHTREERARSKEEPEREILAALPDAAALVARDGAVRVANASFEALAPGGRAIGRTPLEITRSAEIGEAVRRALEGHARRMRIESPSSRRLWSVNVSPLLRGEVLLLLRDVTEARRAEAIRRDFVANASHELKTPIAAILGAAETLQAGALSDPEHSQRFIDMIGRQAARLDRLTKDLLDLSRIETGQWTMELQPLEVVRMAQAVLDLHADRAAEKKQKLLSEVPEGLTIRADARALEQVLVNLVDNAIKYTPSESTIAVRAVRDGDQVELSVVDDGPGIDRHHLPRLFERFYRVDPGRSREQGGTGLGLAIVKHLVQAQGGEVGVESGASGTRFWVRLSRG